jgi:two-component sensor histidine kinase
VPFSRPAPKKSYSVSRVNRMLERIYSIALSAIVAEAIVNGFGQLNFLNKIVFYISTGILLAGVVGVLGAAWFAPTTSRFWLRYVAIITLALFVTWPFHFDTSQDIPNGFQPWIWWPLGIAAVAAGTTFRFSLGVIYLFFITVSWPVFHESGFASPKDLLHGIQEALHLFVFSAVLIAMVLALRWEAGKTDSANQEAIAAAVESARVDAAEIERSRLDALVHDNVLTTLLVAANAKTDQQQVLASKAAIEAISRLKAARTEEPSSTQVTLASFFQALDLRIQQASPEFQVSLSRTSDLPISSLVAEALTEATLQAVDNSLKHAPSATERIVRLRGQRSGLKIVVTDNGKGFRPSQVPKDRLGISSSIVSRVANVGGKVFINSSPGVGTNVVIEWGKSD